jgi:microcystin-dependent protein
MPAFGAVTAETTFGIAPANGAAATLARSDHTHGTPALATTVTDERAWGITPTAGTAGTAARGDHTHGSPDATLQGPTGMVAMWPTATPPGGWLLCNGQAISRTTYATLFSVIGTTWGVGDNSTTFNVPDIRGRVVVGSMGAGSGLTSRALAATGGEEAHVLSVAELASHSHTVNSHNHGGASGASDPNHNHSITYENVTTSFMAANWDHTHGYDRPGMLNIGLSPGSNQYALNRLGDQTASANIDHQHSANHGHSAGSTSINHTHTIGGDSPGTNAQGSGTAHNVMQPWVAMPFVIKT